MRDNKTNDASSLPLGSSTGAPADQVPAGFDPSEGELAPGWDKAKAATRDAWNRFEAVLTGDADQDGR